MSDKNRRLLDKLRKEVKAYENRFSKWKKDARTYVDIFRGEVNKNDAVNYLFANVKNILPALFSYEPSVFVTRTFGDDDSFNRIASDTLGRAIKNDLHRSHSLYDIGRQIAIDMLVVGRGVIWNNYDSRYRKKETKVKMVDDGFTDESGTYVDDNDVDYDEENDSYSVEQDELIEESSDIEYVRWDMFLHDPDAQSVSELYTRKMWVAKRTLMTRGQIVKRFGEEFADVPLNWEDEDSDYGKKDAEGEKKEEFASVIEFWDCKSKTVTWFVENGYDKILDRQKDFLKLSSFFPCSIVYSTKSNEDLVPIMDYSNYKELANEYNEILRRKKDIRGKMRVRIAARQGVKNTEQLLKSDKDGEVVYVDLDVTENINNAIMPLGVEAYQQTGQYLDSERIGLEQQIFEGSGQGDITRNKVHPQEKLGQTKIKERQSGQRILDMKHELDLKLRDALAKKAEIMVEMYDAETLHTLSVFEKIPEVVTMREMAEERLLQQAEEQGQEVDPVFIEEQLEAYTERIWEDIYGLLASEKMTSFEVSIETDDTLESLHNEKDVSDGLFSILNLLQQALVSIQQAPQFGKVFKTIAIKQATIYRLGNSFITQLSEALDALIEQVSQPPPPEEDPAAQAEEAEATHMQMEEEKEDRASQRRIQEKMVTAQLDDQERALQSQRTEMEKERESQRKMRDAGALSQLKLQEEAQRARMRRMLR